MKKLIALLLVLVMVAGLVACAGSNDETKGNDTTNTENTADSNGDSNTGSGEPIYIGLSAKITGADAANGDRMVKAAQMAVDEVNAAGARSSSSSRTTPPTTPWPLTSRTSSPATTRSPQSSARGTPA